jgi:hypothetical protein
MKWVSDGILEEWNIGIKGIEGRKGIVESL